MTLRSAAWINHFTPLKAVPFKMPIISIITQPETSELKAAYRPVVLIVRAARTDDNSRPPVVYCDIYIDEVFYKTQEKTQFIGLNNNNSDWQFDIQDACQEVLDKKLATNPMSVILPVPEIMKPVFCKFRSSGLNGDGFIESEGTAPIQGTGSHAPVAGDGTQSHTFYIVNSALQHEQNQNLSTHLTFHKKNSLWGPTTYPLSHRPNGYKIGPSDADVFPIIHLGEHPLQCLILNYRLKGQRQFHSTRFCLPDTPPIDGCLAVELPGFSLPDGGNGASYLYSVPLTGTAPFSLANIVKPTWMTIAVFGSNLVFSGMPTMADTGITVSLRIKNCSDDVVDFTDTINVDCIPATIPGSPALPDGQVGVPYSFDFGLMGSAPFTLSDIVKPAWMTTVEIIGSVVHLAGTPDEVGTDVPVSFTIHNCSADTVDFSDTIDIELSQNVQVANGSTGGIIDSITPFFAILESAAYPIAPGETIPGHHSGYSSTISVTVSGTLSGNSLRIFKNGSLIQTISGINSAGTYTFDSFTFAESDFINIQLT
jgi:hypothetical protein